MTTLIVIVAIVIALVALALIYSLTIAYAFEEEPDADEIRVVTTEDGWRIRLCRYKATSGDGEPVLIVHGLCTNQFELTVPGGHSLVDHLCRNGFECWCIDMRGTRSSHGPSGVSRYKARLEDVPLYDIPAAIEHILGETGADQVHWVGHSLGGLVYYAYEQIHGPEALASVSTIGSPPGLAKMNVSEGGLLAMARRFQKIFPAWAEFEWRCWAPWIPVLRFESTALPVNWKNTHAGIDAASFYNLVELAPPAFFDSLDNWAHEGAWFVKNGAVDVEAGLGSLKTPMLAIYGASDPLARAATGQAFVESLAIKDKAVLVLGESEGASADYNHVDLAFAVEGEAEVFEPIRQWIAAHAASAELRAESGVARLPGTGEDTSWRKALRRAAEVMGDLDPSASATNRTRTKKKTKSAATKRAKPKLARKGGTKKKATKKTVTKRAVAKKKPTKKKTAVKRKPSKTKAKAPKKKSQSKAPAKRKVTVRKVKAKMKTRSATTRSSTTKSAKKKPVKRKPTRQATPKRKIQKKKATKKKAGAKPKKRG